jgi:hypothetical protein
MIRRKLYCGIVLAGVVALLAMPAAAQGPTDQRTYFTFSAPFEVPGGKTLPAGKYTFRVMDSPSNRHIVQVMSEDGRQLHATVLAIPAERQDPPSDPEIRFMEAAANVPPAIRTWWYPGRSIGHEFVYPKDQARRLAARQPEPVLTVTGNERSAEDMKDADLARLSSSGEETAVTADGARAQTAPPPATTDRAPERPATTTADTTREPRTERTELPRTASPMPLIGLTGVVALLLGGALRLRRA